MTAGRAGVDERLTPDWMAACIATLLEGSLTDMPQVLVIRSPGDPLSVYVLQPGGEHLLIQVNRAELVVT